MLDQIVFTDHLPYIEEDIEPTQPLLLKLNIMANSKRAMIDCIVASLEAIGQANRTFNAEERRIAIVEYKDNLKRALRSGVKKRDINNNCRNAYYQCVAGNLMGIAMATVTGDYYNRVETFIKWYEDDRHRMIEAGYQESVIDSRMAKIKLKLVKK